MTAWLAKKTTNVYTKKCTNTIRDGGTNRQVKKIKHDYLEAYTAKLQTDGFLRCTDANKHGTIYAITKNK